MFLEEPPSIDAGEITDKGYIHQQAVLERRANMVARLYADPAPEGVIRLPVQGGAFGGRWFVCLKPGRPPIGDSSNRGRAALACSDSYAVG
jgi:hypothetical protein